MTPWLAISTGLLAAAGMLGAPPHPWELKQNILRPVDAGAADLHELAASNFQPGIDLTVPTRFERVYRLSDVKRMGNSWTGTGETLQDSSGFVRFSGGVAAVFPYSSYRMGRRGTYAEVPAGTVYRLDLRPPTPGEISLDRPSPSSYNYVATQNPRMARNLAAVHEPATSPAPSRPVTSQPINSQPREAAAPESMWENEAYRAHVLASLLTVAKR
jgi:hypothetical protein